MRDKRWMAISFESVLVQSKFLSPLEGYNEDVHDLEHRKDPLTGRVAVVGTKLKGKEAVLYGVNDDLLLEKFASNTKQRCFMCPNMIKEASPKFSDGMFPPEWEGRIKRGECTLFPNLFPLGEYHAVAALTHDHHLNQPLGFDVLKNGIDSCVEFIKRVVAMESNEKELFMTINMNYLFPSGASVIHPHMQVLGGSVCTTSHQELLEASRRYYSETKKNFWRELASVEKERGERFIDRTAENVVWISSFSPTGVNEIQGIVTDTARAEDLTADDIAALASGLEKVIATYRQEGFHCFNFSLFSAPTTDLKANDWFCCNLKIITRANAYKNYRADDFYVQKLLGTEILLSKPEEIAKKMKSSFQEDPHGKL